MQYIANIITTERLDISSFFNISSTIDSVDLSLPTLIIGWSKVKELYPEQNILDYIINKNICWTFSKREKRYQHDIDIEKFYNKVINNLSNVINYRFYNYILSSAETRNNFISYVNKGSCSIYYNSRMLYIYNHLDSVTLGLSLNDLQYIGINPKEFISQLNVNNNNLIINNLDFIDEKSFFLLKDNVKIAPFLNYLKNCDIYK